MKEKNVKQKSFFNKLLVFMFIICAVVTAAGFSNGEILKGIISLVQTVLFAAAFLLKKGKINIGFSGLYAVLAVIGFALIYVFFKAPDQSEIKKKFEKYVWPSSGISSMVPEPTSKKRQDKPRFGISVQPHAV